MKEVHTMAATEYRYNPKHANNKPIPDDVIAELKNWLGCGVSLHENGCVALLPDHIESNTLKELCTRYNLKYAYAYGYEVWSADYEPKYIGS